MTKKATDIPGSREGDRNTGNNIAGALVVSTAGIVEGVTMDQTLLITQELQEYIGRLMKMDTLFDEVEGILREKLWGQIARLYSSIAPQDTETKIPDANENPPKTLPNNQDDIKKVYRRIAMLTHPDRHIGENEEKLGEMEAIFIEAKKAYEKGESTTVIQILQKLQGKEESIESLKTKFQDLFSQIVADRNFLGVGYLNSYMTLAQYARGDISLITAEKMANIMEGKISLLIDKYLSSRRK